MKLQKKLKIKLLKQKIGGEAWRTFSGPLSCFDSKENRQRKSRANSLANKMNTNIQNIAGAWPLNFNFPSLLLSVQEIFKKLILV